MALTVNNATTEQLMVLLQLPRAAAEQISAARPYLSPGAVPVPPDRDGLSDLTLPAPDLNLARPADLRTLGLADDQVQTLLNQRPIYSWTDLQTGVLGTAELHVLQEVYRLPIFTYTDKLSREPQLLRADSTHLLVRAPNSAHDAESGARPARTYRFIRTVQNEDAGSTLSRLREDGTLADSVVPSFIDARGLRRYLDPEYLVVQYHGGVHTEEMKKTEARFGLDLAESYPAPGLRLLQVQGADQDPGQLLQALEKLNGEPAVLFAEPAFLSPNDMEAGWSALQDAADYRAGDTETALPWHLDVLGAEVAWAVSRGDRDVVLCLVDTAVDLTHPAITGASLAARPQELRDFNAVPSPAQAHGTFVAGLLVGNGAEGVFGVAPGCSLLPLSVPSDGSLGSYARRRAALLAALDRVRPPPRLLINISWKTDGDVTLIREAIQQATRSGALVCCSAGNWPDTPDQPHFPSDYPETLSVGATDAHGQRAAFSYFGRQVDLAAPGGSGDGTVNGDIVSAAVGGGRRADFGTSFSTPQAVGTAGLLWSAHPEWNALQIRDALSKSCVPMTGAGLGAGAVNAGVALSLGGGAGPPVTPGLSERDALNWTVNRAGLEALVTGCGVPRFTARLLIQRRPWTQPAAVWAVLGVTPSMLACLTGGELRPSDPPLQPDSQGGTNLNTAPVEFLLAIGCPAFLARLLIARRPFPSLESVRSLTGMTPALYAQFRF